MDPLLQATIGLLAIAAILTLLIVCPSRAGIWRAVKFFAEDHEEANMLIDRRRAERKALAGLGEVGHGT